MIKLLKTYFYNYKHNYASGITTITNFGANYIIYKTKTIWKKINIRKKIQKGKTNGNQKKREKPPTGLRPSRPKPY